MVGVGTPIVCLSPGADYPQYATGYSESNQRANSNRNDGLNHWTRMRTARTRNHGLNRSKQTRFAWPKRDSDANSTRNDGPNRRKQTRLVLPNMDSDATHVKEQPLRPHSLRSVHDDMRVQRLVCNSQNESPIITLSLDKTATTPCRQH